LKISHSSLHRRIKVIEFKGCRMQDAGYRMPVARRA